MIRKLSAVFCVLLMVMGGSAWAAADLKSELVYRTNLGSAEDVGLLLKQGANANEVNNDGTPLIALASARRDKEGINVIETLLKGGADLNAKDARGQTALFYAARNG